MVNKQKVIKQGAGSGDPAYSPVGRVSPRGATINMVDSKRDELCSELALFWNRFQFECAVNCRFAGILLIGLWFGSALANSIVQFDSTDLQPNLPGQTMTLFLSNQGSTPLSLGGLDLAMQIGNGNPDPGSALLKPAITGVELITGTGFDDFTPVSFTDPANQPFRQFWSIYIPMLGTFPEVAAHSKITLATITLDTTGLFSGQFAFALKGTLAGDTVVYDSFGFPLLDNTVAERDLFIGTPTPVPDRLEGPAMLGCLTWAALFGLHRRLRIGIEGSVNN